MNASQIKKHYEQELQGLLSQRAKFNHLSDSIDSIFDFFIEDEIKHSFYIEEGSISFEANTGDYEKILDSIQKNRPRVIVKSIEYDHNSCTFFVDYNNNWNEEETQYQPVIIKETVSA